jgi:ribosomal protein S18 acetylase RimI-like enzyme
MCVIAGYIGSQQAAPILLEMLEREEGFAGAFYTGLATIHDGKLHYEKVVGDAAALRRQSRAMDLPGTIGIAHGRPAMGGGREWAHPFIDTAGELAYIANGSRGQYASVTDLSAAAAGPFNAGCRFGSAQIESVEATGPTVLPDGRFIHGSDAMCQVVSQAIKQNRAAAHPLLAALTQAFEQWPAEIVSLCLHAHWPDEIVAARHNMPMMIGRDPDGAMYIASMTQAFPPSVNWNMRMAPRAAAVISRGGSIRIEPFKRPGIPVGNLPSMVSVEQRIVGLLRQNEACKADQLMEAVKPLWPQGVLNQKEIVVYEALAALLAEGRIEVENRPVPGMFNQGFVPQFWARWRLETPVSGIQQRPKDDRRTADSSGRGEFHLRPATGEDLPAILAITRDAFGPMSMASISERFFGEPLGGKGWDHYKCRSIIETFEAHGDGFIVCEAGGRTVGYASHWFEAERGIAIIGENAVLRACQGRGIATAMQREIVRRFHAAGHEKWQVVMLGHDYPAQRVYEKLGFHEVARSIIYLRKPAGAAER